MFKTAAKLWPFAYPYRWSIFGVFISGVFVALLTNVLQVLIKVLGLCFEKKDLLKESPYVTKFLLNFFSLEQLQNVARDHMFMVECVAVAFPIYFLFLGLARYYNGFHSRFIAERIANELRFSIMSRLLSLSPTFYAKTKMANSTLINRTLNDATVVQHGMTQYMDLMREPIIALVALTYMFMQSWKLAVFCIIFAPFVGIIVNRIAKKLKSLSALSQESLDVVSKNLKEAIDGIRIIQSYNDEENMRRKFRESIADYNSTRRKVIKRMELSSPLNEFIISFLIAGLCLFVGTMIFRDEMTFTSFMAFIAAAGQVDKPSKKIQQALVVVPQTDTSINRLLEIIDSSEVVTELPSEAIVPFPQNWQTIEFKNVSFKYDSEVILKSVSLKVRRGEVIALVGESGSGKSTLVNLLERFFDPSEGEILIDGININKFSLKDLRDQIALVTQEVFLFNDSLESNISSHDIEVSRQKVKEAAEKANASKFIEKLTADYKTPAGDRGSNFSGGEKQRISIARAIYKNAPILILDEATSALDSASEAEVQKGIQSLMKGRTAFIIAHRLSTISSADRILVMSSGSIVEEGTHTELLAKKGIYHQYQTIQEN